jgi:diadenosine tetraphosphate (Ap4A) HIT family hydrolase
MTDFVLHERLLTDTFFVVDFGLSRVLLMNDSRFPWLVLVPRKSGCVELFDLPTAEQTALIAEITRTSRILRSVTSADKINVGALGNVVAQLHVHVVARRRNDSAWPGPVWGFGKPVPYTVPARDEWLNRLSTALETTRS